MYIDPGDGKPVGKVEVRQLYTSIVKDSVQTTAIQFEFLNVCGDSNFSASADPDLQVSADLDLHGLGDLDHRVLGRSDLRVLDRSDLRVLGRSDLRVLGRSDLSVLGRRELWNRRKRDAENTEEGADISGCYLLYDRSRREFVAANRELVHETNLKFCDTKGPGRLNDRDCFVEVLYSATVSGDRCRLHGAGSREHGAGSQEQEERSLGLCVVFYR